MKLFSLSTLIAIIISLSVNSCKNKQVEDSATADNLTATKIPANKVIDTTVVLEVGKEQFTAFELQKNFKMFKQKFFQNNKRQPEEANIKAWVQEFTERAYLLADARAKGYYTRKDVQDIVETTAVFMLSQPHGILDQKLIAEASQTGNSEKESLTVLKDYHTRIDKSASLNTNITEVAWLGAAISKHKQKSGINKEDIADVSDKKLASYRMPDGKIKSITMKEFMTYYNSLPLRRPLIYTQNIISQLQQMAAIDYIKKDAKEMGLLSDPEFRLNKKNFTDDVVYKKYFEDQLDKSKQQPEQEILNIYNKVKMVMTHPADIVYSVFTFNTATDAYKAFGLLNNSRPGGTDIKLNSVSEKHHIKFDESRSQLPDTLKKMILRIPPGKASAPVATDSYYTVLMVEAATGSKPFSINEIRPYLVARAREVQEINYCHRKAIELCNSYKKLNKINLAMLAGI